MAPRSLGTVVNSLGVRRFLFGSTPARASEFPRQHVYSVVPVTPPSRFLCYGARSVHRNSYFLDPTPPPPVSGKTGPVVGGILCGAEGREVRGEVGVCSEPGGPSLPPYGQLWRRPLPPK